MSSSKLQGYTKDMWNRWKLCHATDFQTLMYPCFIFCRILGMFPYKINSLAFEASKLYYILSSIIVYICCIYNGTFIYNMIFKINFGSTIRDLESACFFMVSSFILIVTHVLSRPQMRLLQTILNASSKLPSKSYQKLSKWIHVKDIIGIAFFVLTIVISKTQFLDNMEFLGKVFVLYCSEILFYMNMLYLNCIYVLNACLQNINDDLTHMQTLILNDKKQYVPTLDRYMQRNHFLIIQIKTLKKWHLMISNTIQMLNLTFSPQIVATTVLVFSNVTFEMYFHAVRWQDGIRITYNKESLDVIFISIICNIMLIMLFVRAFEDGKFQTQEIRTTIHDLHNNTSNEKIKYELQLFSLQMWHYANTFAVKGFTVDASLFTAVVGNVTTYILILIQFLITSHFCDGKFTISTK